MKKKMQKILFLFLSVSMLCACNRQTSAAPKVITKITVSGSDLSQRVYTAPNKLHKFLSYFRSFSGSATGTRGGNVSLPPAYQIVFQYQDGSRILWTQTEDNYLRRSGELWKQLSPEQGRRLRMLLAVIPEDEK